MKILITGIAGFIGSHLAEKLNSLGHEIIGIDNFSPYYSVDLKRKTAQELSKNNIKILEADLREEFIYSTLDNDFNYIFHLAAQPGISEKSTFEDYLSNNVVATKKVIDFALKNIDLKLFVNIGTSSVYGNEACFSEEAIIQPISNYGVTKLAAEQLVLFHSRENHFKACSLRLYSVYGPRERPDKLMPKLVEAAYNSKKFTLFEGSELHLRSFTFVDDIILGLISVLEKEDVVNNEIINIGTSFEYTTQQSIDFVEKYSGKKIDIEKAPRRTGDQSRTKAIIFKAEKLLNYQPKTSLDQGIKKYIDWYVNNL